MIISIQIVDPDEMEELSPWLVKAMKRSKTKREQKIEPKLPELQPNLPEEPKPVEQPEEAPPLQEIPRLDLETVRATLNALKQDKGAGAVRELLEKFNVKRVPDIPEDKYDALMEAVRKIQEG